MAAEFRARVNDEAGLSAFRSEFDIRPVQQIEDGPVVLGRTPSIGSCAAFAG
jgi:hypothetical protein